MDPVLVVGAGISGIAAARTLRAAGLPVTVLDRGKRIGGRMAVRTTDGRPVDTGASYFTVSDPEFESVVTDWQQRGLAHPWTDTFHVYDDGLTVKTGPPRWSAPLGLRSLVEDLASGVDIRQQLVTRVTPGPHVDGTPASAVVLAMPDPQAERLLDPALTTEIEALTDPFAPVLVLTASWAKRSWANDIHGIFVNHNEVISWIADDGHRRGDHAPVLVAHSTSGFAAPHLSDPQAAQPEMLQALRGVLDISAPPATTHIHRWTFAKPASTRQAPYYWGESAIGLCGDAWSTKPRVESAYLSGAALGRAVSAQLG